MAAFKNLLIAKQRLLPLVLLIVSCGFASITEETTVTGHSFSMTDTVVTIVGCTTVGAVTAGMLLALSIVWAPTLLVVTCSDAVDAMLGSCWYGGIELGTLITIGLVHVAAGTT